MKSISTATCLGFFPNINPRVKLVWSCHFAPFLYRALNGPYEDPKSYFLSTYMKAHPYIRKIMTEEVPQAVV